MKKEAIIQKQPNNQFSLYGYEILADTPALIVNEETDLNFFKRNLELLKKELASNNHLYYHLNLEGNTILKYRNEIKSLIKRLGGNVKHIRIELIEKASKDEDEVLKVLEDLNIKVSLDDFGSLASNFDRLIKYKNLIHSIKIDRVFWKNGFRIVKELVYFCEEMGIEVIFEKVETKEDIDMLSQIGKYFQGRYFKTFSLAERGVLIKGFNGGGEPYEPYLYF